jgi:hypothetical protein
MGVIKLDALSAIYVAAPPMMRSLFPKGVSIASKAMVPTTKSDICDYFGSAKIHYKYFGRIPFNVLIQFTHYTFF